MNSLSRVTIFPIWNQSVVPCPVLTVASWHAYSQEGFSRGRSGGLVFPSLSEFSTADCDPHSQRLWHSQLSRNRCFSGTFLLFHDPADVGNLISGSSAFSKTSLNIWKFTVHVMLKPGLKNFDHYFPRMWDECNCVVVWTFFGIAFLWDWNENWPFLILWPLLSFPQLLAYWVQHFHSIIFQDLKELNWNSITSTSFVHSGTS